MVVQDLRAIIIRIKKKKKKKKRRKKKKVEEAKKEVKVEVKVEEEKEEKVEKNEKEEELLRQLQAMGLGNDELNRELLRQYHYDMLATVNALLSF